LLEEISLNLHQGEIGDFWFDGRWTYRIARKFFGLNSTALKGSMVVHQKPVKIQSPKDAIANGIAFVTEDRKQKAYWE
jgi:ABC-type sugar transport system ATPase subunit